MINSRPLFGAGVAAVVIASSLPDAPSARADVLYDSLYIFDDNLYDGGVGNAIGGAEAFPSLGVIDSQVADDFETTDDYRITRIVRDYQSFFGDTPAEGLRVQFYADAGGIPNEDVYAEYIVPPDGYTAIDLGEIIGFRAWRIDMDLSAAEIELPAGAWWLDVQPLDIQTTGNWFWSIRSTYTLIGMDIHVRDGWLAHGNNYYGLWGSTEWMRLDFRGNGSLSMRIEGDPISILTLDLSGSCPGAMIANVSGASPDGPVALIGAFETGAYIIPNGLPCAGTQLGLGGGGLRLISTARADGEGRASVVGEAPAAACGRLVLQALDLASCNTSNTADL